MKNIKLKLDNFRTIENKEIELINGVNCINGRNGFGKSTILHAFKLALYNEADFKLEDYVNWNTDKNYFNINMEFDCSAGHIEIDYTFDIKAKTTRILKVNNEVYNNSEAVTKLNSLFNPTVELVSNFINQNEEGIVNIKPAQRRDFLKGLYDLGFKHQLDDLKIDIEKTDKEITELDKQIYSYSVKQYDIKQKIELPYFTNKSEYDACKVQYEALTRDLSLIETVKKELSDKQAKLETGTNKRADLERKLNNLEVNIPECLDSIHEYKTALNKLDDSKVKELELQLVELKEKDSKIVTKRLPIFDETSLNNIQDKYKELQFTIKAKQKDLDFVNQGKCPTCKRDFDTKDINKLEKEISNMQAELLEVKKELDAELVKKETYLQNKELAEKDKLYKLQITNDISKLESDIEKEKSSIENKRVSYNREIEVNNEKLLGLRESKLEIENTLIDLRLELVELRNFIENTKLDEASLKIKEVEKSDCENKIRAYDEAITLNKSIEEHNKQIELNKKEDKKQSDKLQVSKNEKLSEKAVYVECKDILSKKLPNYILTNLLKDVETEMNNYINKVYTKELSVKIEEKKDSIYIVYGKKGKDITLASGYEKQILNLSYKKAISKLNNGLGNFLILDEADNNSDNDNSLNFYKTLFDNSKLFDFIVVITHKETVKDLVYGLENSKIIEV